MYVFVDKGTIQIKIQLTYQFASFKKKNHVLNSLIALKQLFENSVTY